MFRRGCGRYTAQERDKPCVVTPENPTCQLIGCKVVIRTSDGDYQGVVKHVWGDFEKVSLAKVVAIPSEKKFVGIHHFFKEEILEITVTENVKNVKQNKEEDVRISRDPVQLQPLPVLDMNDQVNTEYVANDDSDDDDDYVPSTPCLTADDVANYAKKGTISWREDISDTDACSGPHNFKLPLPSKYVFLDEINQDFKDSIVDINSCQYVGLATECAKGRFGDITILCVATTTVIYLFDIMVLGAKAFVSGLRNILESSKITKIVHDCRLLSDALYHLCKVELTNVFDTQVGDIVLYMKENNNKLPQYVASLSQCLRKYLSLQSKFLPKDHQSHEEFKKNNALWKIRPFPPASRQTAIHSIIFLKELREVIMEKLLVDLTLGTNIYVNVVREASKEELALNLGSPHVLPPAMSHLTSKEIKFLHHYQIENVNNTSYQNIWTNNWQVEEKLPLRTTTQKPPVAGSDRTCKTSQQQTSDHGCLNRETATKHRNSASMLNEHRQLPRANQQRNPDVQGIQTGTMSNVLTEGSSSANRESTIMEEIRNAIARSNNSALPKNKFIPAGQLMNSNTTKTKRREE